MLRNAKSRSKSVDRNLKNSASSSKNKKLEDLILPTARLKFCPDQLQNLNYIFNAKLLEKHQNEEQILLAKSVVERLVQRLLCEAGTTDSRFASKFLISNNERSNEDIFSKNQTYLVRLDALSTPCLYETDGPPKYTILERDPDYPVAYARIQLQLPDFKIWNDFCNSGGYLRRDKVQTRLVELLAQAASKDSPNSPLQIDESTLCGLPGKVVDAATLYHILNIKSDEQIFYGPGGAVSRFPDPRDFRLAIIDEPGGIRIKVEFLSPALSNMCINVRLLVAIGVDAWPMSTDFPARIPLGHSDCLLYHQAAQTGMYLVGYGVQSSAWKIRLPAAENTILNHYGPNSNVKTVRDILCHIIEEIDHKRSQRGHQASYKILGKYVILSIIFEELEDNSLRPSEDLINWGPMFLSTIVLKLLDKIIKNLINQIQPNYFFKKSNLLVNPGHLCEDDFLTEANNVKLYLLRLFDESLMSTRENREFEEMVVAQETEMNLLFKWKEIIDGLMPPPGTRGRRFCFVGNRNRQDVAYTQYTSKQLEYISLLLQNMLNVKHKVLSYSTSFFQGTLKFAEDYEHHENTSEDLIYLIVTLTNQARDLYLKNLTNPSAAKQFIKMKHHYVSCTNKLVELIRKDKEIQHLHLEDDLILVKMVLKWLYKALDQNKKYLAPILRPYLNVLFSTSYTISWHLDSINDRSCREELNSLSLYAKMVNSNKYSPAQGLVEGINQEHEWATKMLQMVEQGTLRVVFIPERNKVFRHILSLPKNKLEGDSLLLPKVTKVGLDRSKSLSVKTLEMDKNPRKTSVDTMRTMPCRNYFDTIVKKGQKDVYQIIKLPEHDNLRNSSPLSKAIYQLHRRGEHRGCGDILKALMSMQKTHILQDITSSLPKDYRTELLTLIQNVQSSRKKSKSKHWSQYTPLKKTTTSVNPFKNEPLQKYTPKEESAGIRVLNLDEKKLREDSIFGNSMSSFKIVENSLILGDGEKCNTLIKNCRAARLKEDSGVILFEDNLKVKALLRKSESFKY